MGDQQIGNLKFSLNDVVGQTVDTFKHTCIHTFLLNYTYAYIHAFNIHTCTYVYIDRTGCIVNR